MAASRTPQATYARRRKRRMARVTHDLTDEQWAALKTAWNGCAYCGATDRPLQRDCVLPISRGWPVHARQRRARVRIVQREQVQRRGHRLAPAQAPRRAGVPAAAPRDRAGARRAIRRQARGPARRAWRVRAQERRDPGREPGGDLGGRTLRALHLERVVRVLDPLERRGRPDARDDLVELLVRRRRTDRCGPAGTASAR